MEFESFNEGTLLFTGLAVGETAKVDDLLAIIGPEGTDVNAVADNFTAVSAASEPVEETTPPKSNRNTKNSSC